jgi:hypothetical protein
MNEYATQKDLKIITFKNDVFWESVNKQVRMALITVYNKPKDYPNNCVARLWDINKPTKYIVISDTLEELRKHIPEHLTRIPRSVNDDSTIVESYM